MYLKDVLGKRLTNVFVDTRLDVNGLDESDIYLQIDGNTIIGFPWDFEDRDIEKSKPYDARSIIDFESMNEVTDKKITDFLMYDDPMSTGYFELENGIIVHEETNFPHGVRGTGFFIIPNIDIFSKRIGDNYLRYTKRSSY